MTPEGDHKWIRASWLVGADGKRGVVRKKFLEPEGIKQIDALYALLPAMFQSFSRFRLINMLFEDGLTSAHGSQSISRLNCLHQRLIQDSLYGTWDILLRRCMRHFGRKVFSSSALAIAAYLLDIPY